MGVKIFDMNTSIGVYDDHVPALNIGIPAIDLIDIRYGPNAEPFEGYWHTHEDTPDKVSAESLGTVGRMVELGLRSGAWLMTNVTQEESAEPVNEQENSSNETSKESETQTIVTHPLLTALALSSIGLLLLLVGLLILILRKNS
jgi:hypothetical protein